MIWSRVSRMSSTWRQRLLAGRQCSVGDILESRAEKLASHLQHVKYSIGIPRST
jgi:hypothetical protein